jgi:hypothetical protein
VLFRVAERGGSLGLMWRLFLLSLILLSLVDHLRGWALEAIFENFVY